MIRHAVQSTNIKSVGYDLADHVLEIEFHSGGIYQYFGVSESIYGELMAASSYGSYFHRH
ncbi:MAG: KTSC domain-containing protein, partial [Dehalococcoidia bacterium]|nr:KTSC domain-containing protein [Dehalococcoidia bacterium]